MKKYSTLFVLILLTTISYAQSTDDIQKIEMAVNDLYSAMVEKDGESLETLVVDKLTYGHSSGTIENKKEYIDAVMNGTFDYISITPTDQEVFTSGDTAISRHIFVSKGINKGEPVDVRIGVMMTFQKLNGDWKLLARQAYKL